MGSGAGIASNGEAAAVNDQGGRDGLGGRGFEAELVTLRGMIEAWIEGCDPEMQDALRWQFREGSKFFRPLTLFACHRATIPGPIPRAVMVGALVVELVHNMTLVVDDILDRGDERRGQACLHVRFGELTALMVSGFIVAEAYRLVADDVYAVGLISELIKRLGVAECLQWRLRRQVLGVEDWRRIAGEDTGSMFEICACLGDRSGRLRRFGGLLGLLYHGCDDVGDVRGASALGGGGVADVRDGILTLPAALAIRDPAVGVLFGKSEPSEADLGVLAAAFAARLTEAEAYLDRVADEARAEARVFAVFPPVLVALVDQTRTLSA